MQSDLTLDEVLKSVFSLMAQDASGKPKRNGSPVADPALWRALENLERSGPYDQSGIGSHIPFAAHLSGHN